MTAQTYDIAIIGAGMAGASLAAEAAALSPGGKRIVLLEAEDTPGYHATGRSAAFWEECYGGPDIVPLTLASGPYLREYGFLSQRGALYIGRDEDAAAIDAFIDRFAATGATIERLDRDALAAKVPGLRPDWTRAVWEPACADIDVAGLHQHYLSRARQGGVELRCKARLVGAQRSAAGWRLTMSEGTQIAAAVLVNAAGAWADGLAQLAGVPPLDIVPYRRTVAQLETDPAPPRDMPLTLDISGRFYFKPEGAGIWLSPHDETPSEPCDAAPEELDIATAIDRLGAVVDWDCRRVARKWAGLRSFAPDRRPVYGTDPRESSFFWFAGQGGFGIQTAPAAARLGAQLLLGMPRDAMTAPLDPALYDPGRFARTERGASIPLSAR